MTLTEIKNYISEKVQYTKKDISDMNSVRDAMLNLADSAAPSYKAYIALLSQSGTNAPTAVVLQNDLSALIAWTYSSAGTYAGTLADAFTDVDKVYCTMGNGAASRIMSLKRADANQVLLKTVQSTTAVATDTSLSNTVVEIRVYD